MKRIFYIVPLVAVLILAGCSTTRTVKGPAQVTTVKLGVIMPLSGDAAGYGEQVQRVIDYHIEKVNEKYKNDNLKFEIMYEDGKCTGADAVSAFQKLTEIDGVKFIIGGFCSSETLALVPLTKDGKTLLVGASSNPQIDKASDYVFSLSYSDDLIGKKLAEDMSKYKKVAIISEQNDYNIGLETVWTEALKNYPETTIVASEKFAKGGSDFRNVLEKVRKAQPEAIFINPNAGTTSQNLLKQLAEMKDWKGYHLYGTVPYMASSVLALAPQTVEGMRIVDAPTITDSEFMAVKSAIESSKGTLADLGTYYTGAVMDDLNIVSSLIAEFGEDPIKVRNALVSRDFSGYISKSFNFRSGSFPANIGAVVYTVKDGQAVLIQ